MSNDAGQRQNALVEAQVKDAADWQGSLAEDIWNNTSDDEPLSDIEIAKAICAVPMAPARRPLGESAVSVAERIVHSPSNSAMAPVPLTTARRYSRVHSK